MSNIHQVNKIEVLIGTSEYCDQKHPILLIDGRPLDVWLHELYPADGLLGLVPTLRAWVSDPGEQALLKERYTSANSHEVLPVLMCPDDCDFWCTLIAARVIKEDDYVLWEAVGVEGSTREELMQGYACIGTRVEWLDKVPPLRFRATEYKLHLDKIYF